MVLESTIICVDNSEYMRNGDFIPTRLDALRDAVNVICHSKTRANPENNIGLLLMAGQIRVATTLTSDNLKLLSRLQSVEPSGIVNFGTAVRIAHLALKHRQSKHHRMRIIVFVGSPIVEDTKELAKIAKKLKKEKVGVHVVSFGEDNTEILGEFVDTMGENSHFVQIPRGSRITDALLTSPVMQGEDAVISGGLSTMEGGVDDDPELALALRVSMEEERARQNAVNASIEPKTSTVPRSNDDVMMNVAQPANQIISNVNAPDIACMSEEDQIAYAVHMSLSENDIADDDGRTENMEMNVDQNQQEEDDLSEIIQNPEFLQNILGSLPGVDPDAAVDESMSSEQHKGDDGKGKD